MLIDRGKSGVHYLIRQRNRSPGGIQTYNFDGPIPRRRGKRILLNVGPIQCRYLTTMLAPRAYWKILCLITCQKAHSIIGSSATYVNGQVPKLNRAVARGRCYLTVVQLGPRDVVQSVLGIISIMKEVKALFDSRLESRWLTVFLQQYLVQRSRQCEAFHSQPVHSSPKTLGLSAGYEMVTTPHRSERTVVSSVPKEVFAIA